MCFSIEMLYDSFEVQSFLPSDAMQYSKPYDQSKFNETSIIKFKIVLIDSYSSE